MFPAPFMDRALELARAAAKAGEVPVGAVIVHDRRIVGEGANATRRTGDPTAHAEIVAIRMACTALSSDRLIDCDLWVTLEPCAMCAGAISHARIRRLYYATADAKGGAVENGVCLFDRPECLHRPEIYSGIGETKAAVMLRQFFADKR